MKDGEYSTEMITTELGYHVIFREASKEKAAYEDVKDTIKETLANNKMSEDATISTKAMQNLRDEFGLDIIDSDIQSQYAKYIQNALSQQTQND